MGVRRRRSAPYERTGNAGKQRASPPSVPVCLPSPQASPNPPPFRFQHVPHSRGSPPLVGYHGPHGPSPDRSHSPNQQPPDSNPIASPRLPQTRAASFKWLYRKPSGSGSLAALQLSTPDRIRYSANTYRSGPARTSDKS